MGVKWYHVVVFICIFLLMIMACFHEPAYLLWRNVYSCPFLTLSWVLFLLLNCKNSLFLVYTRPIRSILGSFSLFLAYVFTFLVTLFVAVFNFNGIQFIWFSSFIAHFLILWLGVYCQIKGPKDLPLCFLLRIVWL